MNLGKALENLKYDNRMKDWNISQGLVTAKDIEAHEAGLEDLSSKCAPMDLDSEGRRSSSYNGDGGMGHQH